MPDRKEYFRAPRRRDFRHLDDTRPPPPLDRFSFEPNTYSGNLLYGGKSGLADSAKGFQELPVPPGWSEIKAVAAFKPLTRTDVGPDWLGENGL